MDILELFKKILSFRSITPDDGEAFAFIEDYLSDFEVIKLDLNGVKNRFFYKKFGDGEHLCFAGHIDVVPPGDGWDSEPFTPTQKDGFIYARGAQDMKSGLSAFLKAVHDVKSFNGTLSLLLTSDEEGDAKDGTVKMLEHLKKIDFLPDFAIVAEPTCEEKFGDAIKVGRRGSINGVIKVEGKQGHAAYPEKAINPIHQIASILPSIAGYNLDDGDDVFSPSKFVITDIRSGMEVTNVTPGELKMMFNVRNSTNTSQESIIAFVAEHFKDVEYTLELDQSAYPFVTDTDKHIVRVIDRAIVDVCGIETKHSTAGGTSDARFIAPCGVDVIEFGVKNDTIHSKNERTTKEEVEKLYKVFQELIKNY